MDNPTIRAIDRAATAAGGVTDYRLAKLLGVAQTTMSNYRCGVRQLDDEPAEKVAALAGINLDALLAEIAAYRSKSETARAAWLRLAQLAALGRAACLVLTFAVAILAGTTMVGQGDVSTFGSASYERAPQSRTVHNDLQCVQCTAGMADVDFAAAFALLVAVMLLTLGGPFVPRSRDPNAKKKP